MAELVATGIESEDKSQLELKCDVCRLDGETVNGVSVCVDCIDCLCKICSEIHLNDDAFMTHKLLSIDTISFKCTSQTLHELKDMIFCDKHEVQFQYYCEDHAAFICQPCKKKVHRGCKGITEIQSTPQSILNEVYELRTWSKDAMKQHEALKELESAEGQKQAQLKTMTLTKIQIFLDQSHSSNNKEGRGDDAHVETDLMNVEQLVQLQDRNEELLRAVLHFNDAKKEMIVSKRIELTLAESTTLKKDILNTIGSKSDMKETYYRLEILEAITDELVSHCDDDAGVRFNRITQLIREKTYIDTEVQTELIQNTNIAQVCATGPLSESSNVNTKQHAALREASAYKDADVQTGHEGDTNRTITQGIAEFLTASADVDTEPVDVTGISNVQAARTYKDAEVQTEDVGDTCKTTGRTQKRDTKIPLSKCSLEFTGTYNVCLDGEEEFNISGICMLRHGRIALLDYQHKSLKVYDENFLFKMFFQLKWIPHEICVVDHYFDRVAITFDSKRVETYDIFEDTICYVRGFDLARHCSGICSVSRDTIAVLVSDGKGGIEIQTRDINGRINSSIDTFEKEVHNPVSILQDNRNNIIIGGHNQVSAFDRYGDRLWMHHTYKGSKLENVVGMDMDPEGNIYVCSEGSNSIHQVSSLNYRNNRVIIPYVPSPWNVAYDPHQGRLIVSCDTSCVYVYRLI